MLRVILSGLLLDETRKSRNQHKWALDSGKDKVCIDNPSCDRKFDVAFQKAF